MMRFRYFSYFRLLILILIWCVFSFISFKLVFYQNNETGTKYVLLWSPRWASPISMLGLGQERLYEWNCPIKNCFFTDDRNFFGGDLAKFDVLVFNGMSKEVWFKSDLPKQRYPHQKYVFMMVESADRFPVCSSSYDNFFNWTYTYKLDSDCVMPYIAIDSKEGYKVGPNINMSWDKPVKKISRQLEKKLKKRNKTAAWIVSNCVSVTSGRGDVVEKLQAELDKYNLQIDIYGKCGTLNCTNCGTMLENEYFFYLAFENSLCEDYVTEKLYRALYRKVVPIVFGGANYSRFLPPESYLDARTLSTKELAYKMHQMVNDLNLYSSFLSWTNHYEYSIDGRGRSMCEFCELINNKDKLEKFSLYKDFRSWWHPDFKRRCEELDEDPKFYYGSAKNTYAKLMDF